ncbi:hypothetical protein LHYA1_G000160 [Lachnellula hyalina]|uniref:Uncharacterized protein n=1 Tax=Lachnellula hyalina TaxID=1316788 RepID=A0A8H8U4B5_9HELO|nr:uncharacterized protein LHYA1_G000160 [Lachnellula hyalina]TVY31153.1 hypothetical protein LHYA1_G000160 [Lachnellula hyalina]
MPARHFLLVAIAFSLLNTAFAQYGAMDMPAGLGPRQYLGGLEGRDAGQCAQANSHNCVEVNQTDACCPNSQYCIINTTGSVGCCAIGSNCGIECGSSAYICTTTVTNSGTATPTQACCPRKCTGTSQFPCASSLGGGCCPYGWMCQTGANQCVSTAAPTSDPVVSVSTIPSGCSAANQFSCASSLGGGCCGLGQQCVTSGTGNFCSATGSAMLTRTGSGGLIATAVPKPSEGKGLSTGAKAGIGVGVSLGALLIISTVMWFFLVHRHRARQSEGAFGPPAMSQSSGGMNGGPVRRPSPGRGQPSDYFGPAAESGPFTEDQHSAAMSPGSNRGVPTLPQSPNDIAAPVEIDSRSQSNVTTSGVFNYQKKEGPSNPAIELP